MKKVCFALAALTWLHAAHAQQTAMNSMACCQPTATESFARFASDKSFVMSHEAPRPFHFRSDNGHDITFKAADGAEAHGWEIKAASPTRNYLFVIHEWWGLNDYIKKESEQLWKDLGNVNVIALDLYDHKVATTPDEAGKYMGEVKTERAEAIIRGAVSYAGTNARIFTIGWCFGGGWSLQASLLAGKQAAGCVMYYGMPEKDLNRLKGLHADVLGLFANKEQWITPAVVDTFAANMKKAGKKLTVYRYDAVHAFANPSNPHYDKAATEDAYRHVMAFLKPRLK
ncbi:MAG TPA: dienelactone hydrolase family protein [Chitinophagaceae bacterium]|nr:dienelactone hydrolase family protein [Chitinophagaceae bacterium]